MPEDFQYMFTVQVRALKPEVLPYEESNFVCSTLKVTPDLRQKSQSRWVASLAAQLATKLSRDVLPTRHVQERRKKSHAATGDKNFDNQTAMKLFCMMVFRVLRSLLLSSGSLEHCRFRELGLPV